VPAGHGRDLHDGGHVPKLDLVEQENSQIAGARAHSCRAYRAFGRRAPFRAERGEMREYTRAPVR
jgi:hypothetical protein